MIMSKSQIFKIGLAKSSKHLAALPFRTAVFLHEVIFFPVLHQVHIAHHFTRNNFVSETNLEPFGFVYYIVEPVLPLFVLRLGQLGFHNFIGSEKYSDYLFLLFLGPRLPFIV